jgi:Family of unknown function (DUF5947)
MNPPSALERALRRASESRREPEQRCDLCSVSIPQDHRHVLDLQASGVLCACVACSLLFEREEAGLGRYRLVPSRRLRLEADPLFGALDVPVGLAFFVKSSAEGRVVANYPSPMGATRWDLDVRVWDALEARHPEVRQMAPDVEALLVNTARGADERWLVPIDDCYRLVALIRREWRGLSGGGTVWPEIERFFAELAGTSASTR